MSRKNAYAKAGVDYSKIDPFKQTMKSVSRRTLAFPNSRGVYVESNDHGSTFYYAGKSAHRWCQVTEGLGNKNWIAEWMYQNAGPKTYYRGIGLDTVFMAVNDLVAQGAMPVVYTDEVAAGDSDWFADEKRARDLAESFYEACFATGMALPAGESPSLRYLVKATPPVKSAPSLSGCATGIITHGWRPQETRVGDCIIAVASSGLHANGVSLVIKEALKLGHKFLTKLPTGRTLGEEALIPTVPYVGLVEALLKSGIPVHKFLPGTGGGISKIAVDKRPFTYQIHDWLDVPPIFRFMHAHCGVSLQDCLTTFNWGAGYYVFVPKSYVTKTIFAANDAGYVADFVGRVEEGPRKVIFQPKGFKRTVLAPPGE